MSETQLRQRRKEEREHNPRIADDEASKMQAGEMMLDAIQEAKPKPGLSDKAKVFKDKLLIDPYNLEVMKDLGFAYSEDRQWKQCESVLIRGWKRVSELKDAKDRFDYLLLLSKASYNLKKPKQALAILQDIEEPLPRGVDVRGYEAYKCRVYCTHGDAKKGLASFNAAIEGTKYEDAVPLWAGCTMELKEAGLLEKTKEQVAMRADSEEDKARLDSMCAISLQMSKLRERQTKGTYGAIVTQLMQSLPITPNMLRNVLIVFLVFMFIVWLYILEQRSLRSMAWANQ